MPNINQETEECNNRTEKFMRGVQQQFMLRKEKKESGKQKTSHWK